MTETDQILLRYENLFSKLEEISFHPPFLPGALTSNHIDQWTQQRTAVLKQLENLKDQLPPFPPEKILSYRKKLDKINEIINDYRQMLDVLMQNTHLSLQSIRKGKQQLRGYKTSLPPSDNKSGMSWTR